MKPVKADLTIVQGASYRRRLTARGVDLTGCTARLQVREKIGGTVLVNLTTANGGLPIAFVAPHSTLMILIAKASTATVEKEGVYDLFLDYPNGDSDMILHGRVLLIRRVTL